MLVNEIASIVKNKVSTSELTLDNYISTDNMLPNYSGIQPSTVLPAGKATAFCPEDILLSNIRPYFRKIWFSNMHGGCNADIICLRVNSKRCVPQYLYYQLLTDNFINNYVKSCKGAKMPRGDVNKLLEYDFYCPEYEEQLRITNILGTIDRKIQLNECKIKKLDLLVQDIFDFWFVQYDFPNAQGKPYQSSGGQLVLCNELNRAIPCDWKYSNLYEIADFINGLACQKHRPKCCDLSLPVIKIKEMHDGITEHTERATANVPEDYIIHSGDILFSWSATLEVMYWFNTKGVLNQHIFKVVPKEWYLQDYAYRQISQYIRIFKKIAESRKTTMGHITTDHLVQSKIVIPPASVLIEYSKRVSPLLHQIRIISYQLQKLKNIKQNLLPLLMNGQVVVQ